MTKKILPLALGVAALALGLSGVPQAQAGTFLTNAPMISARAWHTATVLLNGKVLVAGGTGIRSAELYDLANGTWTATGAMNHLRSSHSATLLPDGKVLVVGGVNAKPEVYDPATGKWVETGAPNFSSYYATATVLPNRKVLVSWMPFNGVDPSPAELFDPASGTWTPAGTTRTVFRSSTITTLLPNGQVLLAGADGQVGGSFTSEIYNPAAGDWTTITNSYAMSSLHANTAILLYNGRLLIAGGGQERSTQIYNPIGGNLTEGSAMVEPRAFHTATLLLDGKVLVAGGDLAGSAELYDPASGKWTLLANRLATKRFYHTATLLPNGKVLIAGGVNPESRPPTVSSTELYDPEYDKDMLLR